MPMRPLRILALTTALLTCAAVVVLAAGQWRSHPGSPTAIQLPAESPATGAVSTTGALAGPAPVQEVPVVAAPDPAGPRLKIARLGINAPIEAVGLDAKRRIEMASSGHRVGWYRGSPWPGKPGAAILDGHLTFGSGPAVFADLGRLRTGDQLTVVDAGRTLVFKVDALERYAPTASPPGLFATSGPARLALVTCAGKWDESAASYTERLVVRATLAGTP